MVKRYNISVTPEIDGDVNNDGRVTPVDASLIMRHVVGEVILSDCQQIRGDVTYDGSLNGMDAALILQKVTDLIPE